MAAAMAALPRVVHMLRRMARHLRLGQTVSATALTFYHRCRAHWRREGLERGVDEQRRVAIACLFLATKVEEQPKRMRDVINSAYLLEHGRRLHSSHEYWRLKERLVRDEQHVLRAMAFDLSAPPAHRFLMWCAHSLCQPRAVVQLASDAINDSYAEPMCLEFAAEELAVAALAIGHALMRSSLPLAEPHLRGEWWTAFGVTERQLRACVTRMLAAVGLQDEVASSQDSALARAVDVVCTSGMSPLEAADPSPVPITQGPEPDGCSDIGRSVVCADALAASAVSAADGPSRAPAHAPETAPAGRPPSSPAVCSAGGAAGAHER